MSADLWSGASSEALAWAAGGGAIGALAVTAVGVVVLRVGRFAWQRRRLGRERRRLADAVGKLNEATQAAAAADDGEDDSSAAVSRRRLITGCATAAVGGAAMVEALRPTPAQATMAVIDTAAVAQLAQQVSNTVEMIENLAQLARLDKLALEALGMLGMGEGLLNDLFSIYDSVMSIAGSVQRFRQLPARFKAEFEAGIAGLENLAERAQTFEGARGIAEELYGKQLGGKLSGAEARAVEKVTADQVRTAALDQFALAIAERDKLSKDGERLEELASKARSSGSGSGDDQNLRAQMGVLTAVSLNMAEQLLALRASVSTMAQTDSAARLHIPLSGHEQFVDGEASWGPLEGLPTPTGAGGDGKGPFVTADGKSNDVVEE